MLHQLLSVMAVIAGSKLVLGGQEHFLGIDPPLRIWSPLGSLVAPGSQSGVVYTALPPGRLRDMPTALEQPLEWGGVVSPDQHLMGRASLGRLPQRRHWEGRESVPPATLLTAPSLAAPSLPAGAWPPPPGLSLPCCSCAGLASPRCACSYVPSRRCGRIGRLQSWGAR